MSTKYKFKDQDELYFVSFAVVSWIDLFIRNEYRQIMLDSWKHCQANKGLEIYGWCIMPSHIHMIIGSHRDKLENIMRDMKRHTSEQLKTAIRSNPQESRKEWMLLMMEQAGQKNSNNLKFQLWRQDNHPIALYDNKILHQKLDYIHNNPVEAGFVEKPEDHLYSSARDYYGLQGLIEILLVFSYLTWQIHFCNTTHFLPGFIIPQRYFPGPPRHLRLMGWVLVWLFNLLPTSLIYAQIDITFVFSYSEV